MFVAHYVSEPTYGLEEKKANPWRLIFNHSFGVFGISVAFLYLHPEMLFDLFICVLGAALGTVLAHGLDWLSALMKRDRLHGLIQNTKE